MELKFFDAEMKMPLMTLPLRSTVIKTKSALIIYSPIKFTDSQLAEIRDMGKVTDIVAPNCLHHLSIPHAIIHFPEAKTWAAPELEKKRSDIAWNYIFGKDTWPYEDDINIHIIGGIPRLNEVVFFCKDLRTLLVVDLCFNLQNAKGLGSAIILNIFGTYKKFAISRLYTVSIKDKNAFKRSMQKILTWNFDKIVMSHGNILQTKGTSELKASLNERNCL